MIDLETSSSRREDSFLSSRGIDQSTVAMVGAILVVAFLLLSLIGRGVSSQPAVVDDGEASIAATPSETDAGAPDIAGSGNVPVESK
jgi:hypothetical protein